MIGVIAKTQQRAVVEEFFELFKTPWEFHRAGREYDAVLVNGEDTLETGARVVLVYGPLASNVDADLGITAGRLQHGTVLRDRGAEIPIYGDVLMLAAGNNGSVCLGDAQEGAAVRVEKSGSTVIRIGYDLFDEVRSLLTAGQPVEHAHVPTLEVHIRLLREWIVSSGVSLLEIPPAPSGREFMVCLTHDIDFIGIRQHFVDHSMLGFVYRATAGAAQNFLRGRLTFSRMIESWTAAASLPFVYLGWAKDFWEPFDWYLTVERGLPSTYFLIPFKGRAGDKVQGSHASRRATAYDVTDLADWTGVLRSEGCELGVHGLDAWHDAEKGRDEFARLADVTGSSSMGIRMHWLLRDENTNAVLERANYAYDSTCGYNETVGYKAGTGQVFRPLDARRLLELPMHIQDGALFYPKRLDLTEQQADARCEELIGNARKHGGVLTVLWHDRSHGPERFWGDFYRQLVGRLKSLNAWFGTAAQVTGWFRQRREVQFESATSEGGRVRLRYDGPEIKPPLRIRIYRGSDRSTETYLEIPWDGQRMEELELQTSSAFNGMRASVASCSPS